MRSNPPDLSARQELLDADELLQLAMQASGCDQAEQALSLLKRAIALRPEDARLHYMLGAQHAQMGLYERAVHEMEQAVRLDASLHTAHFQIGLLHMTSGRIEEARRAWRPLDHLPEDDALRHFRAALEHLAADEFDAFSQCVQAGVQVNRTNPALSEDMRRLAQHVESQRAAATPVQSVSGATAADTVPTTTSEHHVLLNAYRRQ